MKLYVESISQTDYGDLPVPVFNTPDPYPDNWADIAAVIKDLAKWRCVRCNTKHRPKRYLTVHHLIPAKQIPWLTVWWNLPAMCQSCHLKVENKIKMFQPWMFEHSEWFKPYVAGFYAWCNELPYDRESVAKRQREYLFYGMPQNREIPNE